MNLPTLSLMRLKHQLLSRLAARWPALGNRLVKGYNPLLSEGGIPWTDPTKPLDRSTIALVTTAGVHHSGQEPFDMSDPQGDPSFRVLDAETIASDFRITHDYYDHRDARRDLNIVLPAALLQDMAAAGFIGRAAARHYSFMGHIDGPHVRTLKQETAPHVASLLREEGVDAVLLTPA